MAHCSLHLEYDPTCIQCQRKTRRAEDNVSDDFSTPSFGVSTPDYSPAPDPSPSSDNSDTFSGGGGESGGGGASGDF